MGDHLTKLVLIDMITILYKRFIAQFRKSLMVNIGTEIPVQLWNRGPF